MEVLALCRLCNNIALPSCFALIAHRNQYLMSLCHLLVYISEKSIKITTEQCSFGKQAVFCSCAKCPYIELLALCRLCNNIALPSCFVLIAHRNQYLMSLCHLLIYICEKSIKNTTEQCSLGKQAVFCSCAKCPYIGVLALCRLCNNIALPSCFVLIAHRNQYLMSLCHLLVYISEKSIKITTEQCSLGKQAIFCSCAKCP